MKNPYSDDPFSIKGTFQEFKQRYDALDKSKISIYTSSRHGLTPFHMVLDQIDSKDTKDKLEYLLTHIQRLGLDINMKYSPRFKEMPDFLKWDNTPISHALAYENFDLVLFFLEKAEQMGIHIDLNLKDKSGKTPLLLAIKLCNTPLKLVQKLITDENYNTPDHYGTTPMMLAAALRRKDILALLIEKKIQEIEKNNDASSMEKKQQLQQFLAQKHPVSGKTLAHFAILRSGTLNDFAKEPEYQETVLNILKEAGIEGFRDEKANWNCVTNTKRDSLQKNEMLPGVLSLLSFSNQFNLSNKVYLSCQENIELFNKFGLADMDGMEHLSQLKYSGTSLVESVLSRTTDTLEYLTSFDFDFNQNQKNGKSLLDYIQGLEEFAKKGDQNLVSKADKTYLVSLKVYLEKLMLSSKRLEASEESEAHRAFAL